MKTYLITGAPCSGKSTYVREHKSDNDVIFDWDALFIAITGIDGHSDGTDAQTHVVNRLRYDLIRAAQNEAENIETLWVIAVKPSAQLNDALGDFEEIHLDVTEEEAKKRADADDSRLDKDNEYARIEAYFHKKERKKMAINSEREYRNMMLEIRKAEDEAEPQDESKMVVRGYATTFNEAYTLFEDDDVRFDEIVDANAFADTNMDDVIMQYDHEGRVFARVSNNTLTITPDEHGLLIEADLGGTELGRQLFEEIKGGYTSKMSFGFTVENDEEDKKETEDGKVLITRTIKKVRKLYDVSAVSLPANDATEISVRNLSDGVIAKVRAERLEAQKEKEALELRRRKLLMRANFL